MSFQGLSKLKFISEIIVKPFSKSQFQSLQHKKIEKKADIIISGHPPETFQSR